MDFMEDGRLLSSDTLEEFKDMVSQFVKYDDDIRKMRIAIKERTRVLQILEPKIVEFMNNNNVEDVTIANGVLGRLKCQKQKVQRPGTSRINVRKAVMDSKDIDEGLKRSILGLDGGGSEENVMFVSKIKRHIPKQNPRSLNV